MTTEEKIQLVIDRFFHRSDTYAIQWHDETRGTGYYPARQGKCKHNPPCGRGKCPSVVLLPITHAAVLTHLKGDKTLGVYQLGADSTVQWGCIDIDGKKVDEQDRKNYTKEIARELYKRMGAKFLVEDSGNKGYHIWIFLKEPVQAKYISALLRDVVTHVERKEGLTTEVFPKQSNLQVFGNLVKLPLGLHQKTQQRCFFVDNQFKPHNDQWSKLKNIYLLDPSEIKALTENIVVLDPPIRDEAAVSKFAKPCYVRMMQEGIGEGGRDDGMFRLACHLRSEGLSYDMVLSALLTLNQKNRPPLTTDEIETKVRSAFSGSYNPLPCSVEALDSFCSSSCSLFAKKCENRGYSVTDAVGRISRD